jgi:hypothetical protein
MKKDALDCLQEQGYTHVLRHGRCVCLTAILLTGGGVFMISYSMLLTLVSRDVS